MVLEKIPVRYSGSLEQSDEDIARAASNLLGWNVSVPGDSVKAQVQDGAVTLSGFVDWEYQKFAAGEAVRYFTGVVSVSNKIAIKPKLHSRW